MHMQLKKTQLEQLRLCVQGHDVDLLFGAVTRY